MKTNCKIYIILSLIFLFVTVLNIQAQESNKEYVMITEVMYDSPLNEDQGKTPHNHGEYIEIFNAGNNTVDISGWYLIDSDPYGFGFPEGTLLPPQSYAIVAYRCPGTDFELSSLFKDVKSDAPKLHLFYQSVMMLNNSEELIQLWDKQGVVKDKITYRRTSGLVAKNGEGKPVEQCLSLQRKSVSFDNNGCTIINTADWVAGLVTPYSQSPLYVPPFNFNDTFNYEQKQYSNDQNYILTAIPTEKTDNFFFTEKGFIAKNSDAMLNITYMDGLGRNVQNINIEGAPNKEDLVDNTEYDMMGRPFRGYLPINAENNVGEYIPMNGIHGYYIEKTYPNESKPYSTTVYDQSPLNRVKEQYGPGQEWYDTDDGKPVKTDYLTNVSSGNISLVCKKFWISSGMLFSDGDYAPQELYVTKNEDEDNNISYTFKDKLGKTVLVRNINDNQHNDTYYIYDDFSNLIAVLPPMLAEKYSSGKITTSLNYNPNINNYAYLYEYDECQRCIRKKLPGCDWISYVYDNADRLIFSQDGTQRMEGYWTFNKYDSFGRIIISGQQYLEKSHGELRSDYKGVIVREKQAQARPETPYGYTWNTMHDVGYSATLLVNHYDDYTHLLGQNPIYQNNLNYEIKEGFDERYIHSDLGYKSAKGLLTGTREGINGSMNEQIVTVYYYDEKGRMVQRKSINHLGGYDKEFIAYNFTGQPIKRLLIHTVDDQQPVEELYTFEYDHVGRLLKTTHRLNNQDPMVIAENEYDNIGRLSSTQANDDANLKTEYTYNIRSQISTVSNPFYQQNIYYNESNGKNTPLYNGNISAVEGNDSRFGANGYIFEYDNLSRLTEAIHVTSRGTNEYGAYYEYDKHGNVLNLKRRYTSRKIIGRSPYIDILNFEYTGNQLKKIIDNSSNINGFKYFGSVNSVDYFFNGNGSLENDANRGVDVSYNMYNGMPDMVYVDNPLSYGYNTYKYTSTGKKLSVTHYWDPNYTSTPVIGSTPTKSGEFRNETVDYVDNLIYEKASNGRPYLQKILISNGFVSDDYFYHFYIKDHLGNVRVVVDHEGDAVQYNNYYPFGLPNNMVSEGEEIQPYKHGGKEYDMVNGLGQYDYHARQYDPSIIRFTSFDPLTEMKPWMSPYVYCSNNPISRIDPTGLADIPQDEVDWPDFDWENDRIGLNDLVVIGHRPFYTLPWGDVEEPLWDSDFRYAAYSLEEFDLDVEQSNIGTMSTIFSGLGEYSAYRANRIANEMFKRSFERINIRGAGHLDEYGKIWRGASNSGLVKDAMRTKVPALTRYGTYFGKIGAGFTAVDVSMSFNAAANSVDAESTIYHTVDGFQKMPSFIPGPAGIAYGILYEPAIKPLWLYGAEQHRQNLERGMPVQVIFNIPGMAPSVPFSFD